MKNLIQLTTVLFLLVQINGYSQTADTKTNVKKQENSISVNDTKTEISTKNLEKFIGEYVLEEANFKLEIVKEKDKMYIITEFSKDQLLLKNETTLLEFTKGVELQLIADNKNALKFTQNGYEAIIKRVKAKEKM